MNKKFVYLCAAILIASSLLWLAPEGWAATESLESSALRVEVNTSPYSFRVLERSTGEVLLSQNRTAFTSDRHFVTEATDVKKQPQRSEEHTSELQSRRDLVCRLLLEKKKNNKKK